MDQDAGLLALANFALKCSVALHETVNGYKLHSKRVRALKEELESLNKALETLSITINSNDDATLAALKLPLWRCGVACREFEESIINYSRQYDDGNMSFRDWAKIRYIGEDIDGFRQMMACYKSTIIISLAHANL